MFHWRRCAVPKDRGGGGDSDFLSILKSRGEE